MLNIILKILYPIKLIEELLTTLLTSSFAILFVIIAYAGLLIVGSKKEIDKFGCKWMYDEMTEDCKEAFARIVRFIVRLGLPVTAFILLKG